MNKLNYNDKIFVAGYFESSGGINLIDTYANGKIKTSRICFSSKRKSSLDKLQTITGIGKVTGPFDLKGRTAPFWRYTINPHKDVIDFIDVISPYLTPDRLKYIEERLDTSGWHIPKKKPEKPCPTCGNLTTNPKFCSIQCFSQYTTQTTKRVKLKCEHCDKPVTRTLADHQYRLQKQGCKHVYCSHRCAGTRA